MRWVKKEIRINLDKREKERDAEDSYTNIVEDILVI